MSAGGRCVRAQVSEARAVQSTLKRQLSTSEDRIIRLQGLEGEKSRLQQEIVALKGCVGVAIVTLGTGVVLGAWCDVACAAWCRAPGRRRRRWHAWSKSWTMPATAWLRPQRRSTRRLRGSRRHWKQQRAGSVRAAVGCCECSVGVHVRAPVGACVGVHLCIYTMCMERVSGHLLAVVVTSLSHAMLCAPPHPRRNG